MAVSRINEAGLNVNQYGNRNLVINGAMQVSQRGTSTTSANVFLIDRFQFVDVATTQYASTYSQDTDAPSGFSNSLKVTTTTAETTIDAGDLVYIPTKLEGLDLQRLGYGTSSAKTMTLSFYVKSSVTGTFCIGFYQNDGPYNYTTTYTIDTANTWERKTLKITGNTSNTIANDNTEGLRLSFILAAGSTYNDGSASNAWESYATDKYASGHVQNGVVTTLNATWQLTGVQLEVGDTATDFEHRSYADELARCQRYYWYLGKAANKVLIGGYQGSAADDYGGFIPYPVQMRATPTFTKNGTWTVSNCAQPNCVFFDNRGGTMYAAVAAAGNWYSHTNGTDDYMEWDAEL